MKNGDFRPKKAIFACLVHSLRQVQDIVCSNNKMLYVSIILHHYIL